MEAAKSGRIAAKGWLTRETENVVKVIQDGVAGKNVNKDLLENAIDKFKHRLSKYDEAQERFEMYLTEEKDILADISESGKFRDEKCKVLLDAELILKKLSFKASAAVGSCSTSGTLNARLPKIELPKFDGSILEWTGFWSQFNAVVHDTDLPDIAKFTYLQSLLIGEAKSVISGLQISDVNYAEACRLLKDRYDRPDRIIFGHIQALLNITIPESSSSVNTLWSLQDELQGHVRSLETLGISGSQYSVLLAPIILSRLPADIRNEWARSENKSFELDSLLKFLKTEIQCRERSETFSDNKLDTPSVVALPTHQMKPISRNKCSICGKGHLTHKCWKLTKVNVHERKQRVKNANLCFRCLKSDHFSRNCTMLCSKCKGPHNSLLCTSGSGNESQCHNVRHAQRNDNVINNNSVNHVQTASNNSCSNSSCCNASCTANNSAPLSYNSHANAHVGNSAVPVEGQTVSTLNLGSTGTFYTPSQSKGTVLQTAGVFVKGKNSTVKATVLFDTGSDCSYVSSRLVKLVAPDRVSSQYLTYSAFGSNSVTNSKNANVYELNLEGVIGSSASLNATEVPVICTPMGRVGVPRNLVEAFGPIQFADVYSENRELIVDILVGLDYYWKFLKTGVLRVPGLVAQETIFGWILSGAWGIDTVNVAMNNVSLCCLSNVPDSLLRRFWDLESVGITHIEKSVDDITLDKFNETVQYHESEQRYEVQLPWKNDPDSSQLVNNEYIALNRLNSLNKYLSKRPDLKHDYDNALRDMENNGIIVEVTNKETSNPVFYMPHRPVVKETSSTTRVRPVFDASAKTNSGISLNDCMHSGPSLIPNIVDVLLRFRRWQIGLCADISKAFLQIKVHPSDQDVHRFFWDYQDSLRTMKFTRVPFGNTCSPFLLNATIKHHLSKYPESHAVHELNDNLYVDDWLTGADTALSVCNLFTEGSKIMNDASMILTKSVSNSSVVSHALNACDPKHVTESSVKILGLNWNIDSDLFTFDGFGIPLPLKPTKRNVLSCIARLFDPLGLLNPFTVALKLLFQSLWKLGIEWDAIIPDELAAQFSQWIDGMQLLKEWNVNRCYFKGFQWNNLKDIEVHVFCDAAASKGYGACVYLRIPTGSECTPYQAALVVSRARVAPIKSAITLPRLELMSALLGARLLTHVMSCLRLSDHVQYRCWSDSTITLSWIRGEPNQWKTFVANRVREIQSLTNPANWLHCPGTLNPADLLTRGITAKQLMSSTDWLYGPDWLSHHDLMALSAIPPPSVSLLSRSVDKDIDVNGQQVCVSVQHPNRTDQIFPFHRWSSFEKSVRIVAYVLRFVKLLKTKSTDRNIDQFSFQELDNAQNVIFTSVQQQFYGQEIDRLKKGHLLQKGSSISHLSPFLDSNDVIRMKGRLQMSDLSYEEKHPMILPKCHISMLLFRSVHKHLMHPGVDTMLTHVRNKFLILGARRLAKMVKKECVSCMKQDSKAFGQIVSPLPELRITQAPVFSVTGMDYGGPLYCQDFPGRKLYILLFTCAVVRAVHLELTDSLSLEDFMLAIRRFISRRGLPSIILSDNAKTFIAASDRLLAILGPSCPQFRRITPLSPWWGGWWERLVGSTKSSLRKSVGKACLKRVELETTLVEVEACINSRPLTVVTDGADSCTPLTPSHFLIGRQAGFQPKVDIHEETVTHNVLTSRETYRIQRLNAFWDIWRKQYICNLPPTVNKFKASGTPKVHSVVLLREDHVPRLKWPLGVITKVFPGKDQLVRSVEVKTSRGFLQRPIQLLHDLEVGSPSVDVLQIPPASVDVLQTPLASGSQSTAFNDNLQNDALVGTTRSGKTFRKNSS